MIITVAKADEQVYLTEIDSTSVTRPLHLSPGRMNGIETDPTPEEVQRWAAYNF